MSSAEPVEFPGNWILKHAFAIAFVAKLQQHVRNWNSYGTNFLASAAEAGSFRQVAHLFNSVEGGRQHCTYWTAIYMAITVAAGLTINRTNILACAAANAAKDFAIFALQSVGATVVEQDKMHVPWPVKLV